MIPHQAVDEGIDLRAEPYVSYSVKDILGRVEGKLDAALISLATKAEHSDLLSLSERVNEQAQQIRDLQQIEENRATQKDKRVQWTRFITPTIISLIATLAIVLSVIHPL